MPEIRVEASIATLTLPWLVFTVNVSAVAETMVPRMCAGGSAAIAVVAAETANTSQKTRARRFVRLELEVIVVSTVKGARDCSPNEVPGIGKGSASVDRLQRDSRLRSGNAGAVARAG